MTTRLKPKLMIIGHARHGKDTVGELLREYGDYQFTSSSEFVGRAAVYPAMMRAWQDFHSASMRPNSPPPFPHYQTFEAAFADRGNHRAFWYDAICAYNTPDPTRLARELFAAGNNIYVGMRNHAELSACKDQKVCDFVLWVEAYPRVPREDSSSCTVRDHQANWIINNNGSLEELDRYVWNFYQGFLLPWERRLANPEPALPNLATKVQP